MTTQRGFGLAGEIDTQTIVQSAIVAEAAGYGTFWLSQPATGSSLAKIARVADATSHIRLGIGAIPLTRQSPSQLLAELKSLSLPPNRLRLGIGSGTGPGSLERLRHGINELRTLTDVEIVVAPLGPKMCRLAGQLADAVLLNWLTPAYAEMSKSWIIEGAEDTGRPCPVVATYVRCALGESARSRLVAECERYGSFPHYARHFARQNAEPMTTTILARTEQELRDRLAEYERALDHVVIRAITPTDSPEEIARLVQAGKGTGD